MPEPTVTHRSSRRARVAIIGGLVLVLLATATWRRIATEGAPPLVIHRLLAAYTRLPGHSPQLAWPGEGEAAVEVEGVGSLGGSGGSTPVPIASVAKVMTAYLTLLAHPLRAGVEGFTMIVTGADVEEEKERAALGESTLEVRAGERLTERQALQALLLPSANNIAALLAARSSGGSGAFVQRMNSTASKLGMVATRYTDPSGFDDDTVSTAADQLKLAQVAMRVPAFAEIVDERSAVLPVVGRVGNYNGLVGHDGFVGIKTGSDAAAGGCLVFAKRVLAAGRRLTVLGVVLGQRGGSLIEAALASARALGDSAASAVRAETVLPSGTSVLSGSTADGRRLTATTAATLREVGWGGLTVPVRVVLGRELSRPQAGERMATVVVLEPSAVSTAALATRSLGAPSLGWRLRHLV
jgi:D-alanyl-D-alanine carboxypeptidase (penicillin-binding protein 5/6)